MKIILILLLLFCGCVQDECPHYLIVADWDHVPEQMRARLEIGKPLAMYVWCDPNDPGATHRIQIELIKVPLPK